MLRSLSIARRAPLARALSSTPNNTLAGNFGLNLFSRAEQEKYVPAAALDGIDEATSSGKPVAVPDADAYARGLMNWGLERGARYVLRRAWLLCGLRTLADYGFAFVARLSARSQAVSATRGLVILCKLYHYM